MTKRQKRKKILEAAALIANGKELWSCWAISRDYTRLCQEYAKFYGQKDGRWYFDDGTMFGVYYPQGKRIRVLMLLWFAESLK